MVPNRSVKEDPVSRSDGAALAGSSSCLHGIDVDLPHLDLTEQRWS
jgi:hypothetical protein